MRATARAELLLHEDSARRLWMMGWADLFKSKSSKSGADSRIRWFGKLPSYADYYSSSADEEWAVEFHEWVMRGFELYQSRLSGARARYERLPISACALRLPRSAMTVLASVLDYGGDMRGRPFPMCFYVGLPSAHWAGPTSDRLVGAGRVLRDLLALRRDIPRFLNSPGRFEAAFGGREVDLSGLDGDSRDTSWMQEARTVRLDRWFSSAFTGPEPIDAEAWFAQAARWGQSIAELDSKKFEPTLRFPLSAGVSIGVQIAGWMKWLETRMNLKRRALSLIISGDLESGCGRLTVVAREIMPDDFLLLTPMVSALGYVDDLSVIKPLQDPAIAAPVHGHGSSDGSWLDFVEAAAPAC